jgi:hypothetical protein
MEKQMKRHNRPELEQGNEQEHGAEVLKKDEADAAAKKEKEKRDQNTTAAVIAATTVTF